MNLTWVWAADRRLGELHVNNTPYIQRGVSCMVLMLALAVPVVLPVLALALRDSRGAGASVTAGIFSS